MMSSLRNPIPVLLAALLVTGTTCLAPLAPAADAPAAQEQKEFAVDIPRLPLPVALDTLKDQTHGQFLVLEELPDTLVGPLVGPFSLEAALARLLHGTGVLYEKVDARTFLLKSQLPQSAEGESEPVRNTNEVLEEVLVTGSRASMPPGSEASVMVVYSRVAIRELGPSTVGELLKYMSQQAQRVEGRYSSDAQYPELRGIGLGSTSVRLNGRRMPPTAGDWADTFDLSLIPMSAVERVEVISEPAPIAFGSRGGGTLNVILKKQFEAPEFELQYGTSGGGGAERRISSAIGMEEEGNTKALILEYFDRKPLLGAARDRWNNQDFHRFGGRDYRAITSSPGNISSVNGEPLPGLPSSFAAIPAADSDGLSSQDFLATAGTLNLESLNQYRSVRPAARRISLLASAERKLSHGSIFGEAFCVEREIEAVIGPPTLSGVIVPAENPFNPFGVPVRAHVLLTDLESRSIVTHSTFGRLVAGLRGELDSWDWELSMAKNMERGSRTWRNELDTQRVSAALAQTEPQLSLNLFTAPAGSATPLDLLRIDYVDPYQLTGSLYAVSLQGPLRTPLGELSASMGAEWERQTTMWNGGSPRLSKLQREAGAGFVELLAPLAPLKMDVTVGGRVDYIEDLGATFNRMFGLAWKPSATLRLHAAYGTSYRAPSVPDLMLPRLEADIAVTDPLRGNQTSIVTTVYGGNPALEPTSADSFIAGIALTLGELPLRLSASYWSIEARDRIVLPSTAQVLQYPSAFPGRVVRGQPTPADLANGYPGPLLHLDVSRANGGVLETSGVDLVATANMATALGRFTSELLVTLTDRYAPADVPGIKPVDRAGIADPAGTVADWRAVASLQWAQQFTHAAVIVRYVPAYKDFQQQPTARTIPSQALVDLQMSLDLGALFDTRSFLSRTRFTIGVQNLLDSEPHFAEVGGSWGFDGSQGDLVQRFVYVRLSHQLD